MSSVVRSLPKPFSAGHSVELKCSTKDDMILSSLEDFDGGRQAAAIAQARGRALGFNVEEWAC